nr:DUF3375 family protein [Pseudomonas sp. M47T1]
MFHEDRTVPFDKARVALETELPMWQELYGLQDNAGIHLRHWIHAGWLREHDDPLTRTDAFELAMRFAQSLEHRDSSATTSHLRLVQDAVRDLATAQSPARRRCLPGACAPPSVKRSTACVTASWALAGWSRSDCPRIG